MILYGLRLSPFVRKVLVYAAEKGMALDFKPGGFGMGGPEFEAASPFRKVPALIDGDFSISDSSAIITYLEALYPEPPLIPADPRGKARVAWFDEFADTILFGTGRKLFFNRVVGPKLLKVPCDPAEADRAEAEQLPGLLAYLESVVPDSGFLLGDGLTLADIAVASPLVNIGYAGVPVDGAAHPRLKAWLERIWARPAFAAILEAEQKLVPA